MQTVILEVTPENSGGAGKINGSQNGGEGGQVLGNLPLRVNSAQSVQGDSASMGHTPQNGAGGRVFSHPQPPAGCSLLVGHGFFGSFV